MKHIRILSRSPPHHIYSYSVLRPTMLPDSRLRQRYGSYTDASHVVAGSVTDDNGGRNVPPSLWRQSTLQLFFVSRRAIVLVFFH